MKILKFVFALAIFFVFGCAGSGSDSWPAMQEALDAMEEDNKMDDVPAEDYLTNEEIVEYNDGIIEGGPINNNDFDEENLPNPKEAVGFAPDSDMVAKINDVE